MDNQTGYIEDLRIIRRVMEESSRFLSLSGLSGFFTGLIALGGAAFAVLAFMDGKVLLPAETINGDSAGVSTILKTGLTATACFVLVLAVGISLWFSYRKSVKKGLAMWTPVSRRLLVNLLIPLISGGILILILYVRHDWLLIIPSMLIFYGLALVNAGKFTYSDIFYLGIAELVTGLLAALFPVLGILFWCFGFGLLHITYGLIMYRKYEK